MEGAWASAFRLLVLALALELLRLRLVSRACRRSGESDVIERRRETDADEEERLRPSSAIREARSVDTVAEGELSEEESRRCGLKVPSSDDDPTPATLADRSTDLTRGEDTVEEIWSLETALLFPLLPPRFRKEP